MKNLYHLDGFPEVKFHNLLLLFSMLADIFFDAHEKFMTYNSPIKSSDKTNY